ncbi:hypothetical protein ACF8Q9_08470 [Pseudomonas sp. TYF_15]|uniref:Uncharacterized protein n=1 Tax=Pseudomonas putida TaxID=303 RepID=A0AAP9MZ10_PSEPU|nr:MULTISPECIES: hypothetical protein [Gammaproteobacteria]ATP49857.1 hypothetical protein CR512_10970 [Pseudomonas putida]MBP2838667.1 hypothetical protein [Pseudomonas sp. PNP]MDE4539274.1 hypothetical protein [Pseudomonas sp. ITEM 17296]MDH0190653.1 hypothetical protein [Stenotrophomonas sp. GD04051]MDH0466994.1 hypothetical protein [Stenotrophomonas sp. GD03993]
MASHSFLLTYSVSPYTETDRQHQNQAVRLRQKLNRIEIEEWNKLETVETAFKGVVHLSETTITQKRNEAEDIAWNQIKEVMESLGAYKDTTVHVVMMVQGLGEIIEFKL